MISDKDFSALIARVRAGDQSAAAELVTLYEPEIRRAARLRLTDPELRRLVDSVDISQSVFGKFFNRIDDNIELQSPAQLLALLTKMTSNRVIDEHRKRQTSKRGGGAEVGNIDIGEFQGLSPGPRTSAISKDLLENAKSQMSSKELDLLNRRCDGESWDEIAEAVGGSAEALRKQLGRALERVRETIPDESSDS